MTTTTFISGTTIASAWLNDVNAVVYGKATITGNPIQVDLAGNVGIGGFPGAKLDVYTGASTRFKLQESSGNIYIDYLNQTAATWQPTVSRSTQFAWYTAPSGTPNTGLILSPTGYLGLGISPAVPLDIRISGATFTGTWKTIAQFIDPVTTKGIYIGYDTAAQIATFISASSGTASQYTWVNYTGSTWVETMRLDSNANLMLGQITASNAVQSGFFVYNTTPSTYVSISHANGQPSGNTYLSMQYNAVQIGSVSQSGTTAVLYNTTSDQRLKENIKPALSASKDIDAIKVRTFDWKSTPDETVKYGFIAQELVKVAPYAVKQGDDGDVVVEQWAVDASKLVPMMVKEIQDLRKRVALLEKP
jgi:hypothetical protein